MSSATGFGGVSTSSTPKIKTELSPICVKQEPVESQLQSHVQPTSMSLSLSACLILVHRCTCTNDWVGVCPQVRVYPQVQVFVVLRCVQRQQWWSPTTHWALPGRAMA